MLGASADNSYTGFLRRFTKADGKNDRLILLESVPFPSAFKALSDRFKTTTLDEIFTKDKTDLHFTKNGRSSSQSQRRPSSAQAVTRPKVPQPNTKALRNRSNGPKRANLSTEENRDQCVRADLSLPGVPAAIFFNKDGIRLDPYISFGRDKLKAMQDRKLCNKHFLLTCQVHESSCPHSHMVPTELSNEELQLLKAVARRSACTTTACIDPYCISGHRCPYNVRGRDRNACHFPPEMHGIDSMIDLSKTVKVHPLP